MTRDEQRANNWLDFAIGGFVVLLMAAMVASFLIWVIIPWMSK